MEAEFTRVCLYEYAQFYIQNGAQISRKLDKPHANNHTILYLHISLCKILEIVLTLVHNL